MNKNELSAFITIYINNYYVTAKSGNCIASGSLKHWKMAGAVHTVIKKWEENVFRFHDKDVQQLMFKRRFYHCE